MDELVVGDPIRVAAAVSQSHTTVIETISSTRRRAGKLAKLLSMDKSTLEAALRWQKKTKKSTDGNDESDEEDDYSSVASSAPSFLSLSSANGSTQFSTLPDGRALEKLNLFSPSCLRHGALAALAMIYALIKHEGQVGPRAAFVQAGGVDAPLLLGYYTWADEGCVCRAEKEVAAHGKIDYEYQDGLGMDEGGARGNSRSLTLSRSAFRTGSQEEVGAVLAPSKPSLVDQARAHLANTSLLSRAEAAKGTHAERGSAAKTRRLSGPRRQAAVGRRTACLAEALLAQVDSGDLVQLKCARAAGSGMLGKAVRDMRPAVKARQQARGARGKSILERLSAPTESLSLMRQEWLHPLRCIDRSRALEKGAVSAAATAAVNASDDAHAKSLRRARSLLLQLRLPDSALFHRVEVPLGGLLSERWASEGAPEEAAGAGRDGVTASLRSDARQAKRAASNKSLSLRDRLAAAVAGARIENAADLRSSQVMQQRAMAHYSKATATKALVDLGNAKDFEGELASRLTGRVVDMAQQRVSSEEQRAKPTPMARLGDEEDNDLLTVESELSEESSLAATLGKSRRSQRRKAAEEVIEVVITVEELRAGKVVRIFSRCLLSRSLFFCLLTAHSTRRRRRVVWRPSSSGGNASPWRRRKRCWTARRSWRRKSVSKSTASAWETRTSGPARWPILKS